MGKAGKVLKTVLGRYGISQGKLAAVMGIGSSNVYRWCNEIRDPNSETVLRIVDAIEKIDLNAAGEFRHLYMGDVQSEKD